MAVVPTTITFKTTFNFNDVNYILKAITLRLKSQYSCVGITAMPCIGGTKMYKLKKPENIPVETLLGDIEMKGRKAPNLVTYSSEAPGTGYIVDTEEGDVLMITTRNGNVRIRMEDVSAIAEELHNILEDMVWFHGWRKE